MDLATQADARYAAIRARADRFNAAEQTARDTLTDLAETYTASDGES